MRSWRSLLVRSLPLLLVVTAGCGDDKKQTTSGDGGTAGANGYYVYVLAGGIGRLMLTPLPSAWQEGTQVMVTFTGDVPLPEEGAMVGCPESFCVSASGSGKVTGSPRELVVDLKAAAVQFRLIVDYSPRDGAVEVLDGAVIPTQ